MAGPRGRAGVSVVEINPSEALTDAQEQVLNLLGECPTAIDQLVEQTALPVQQLSALLVGLQLEGHVSQSAGGYVLAIPSLET